ncbi:uncharacterized protein LOC130418793 isoform X2 [Triplophysa dalaica]|uniref:uncharacterized protein LOC130418793 isoform X2 n=1 Tax=Triplophysa dalaica TaxID=1582913 RepID=UPI0024DF7530|nr:uncharacterized protein LOC130418793 isoform X2 [Triplophysa dalaica]
MNACRPAYLRTKCQKYVCVESRGSRSTPQIVAKSFQLNSTNSRKVTVTVNERTGVDNVKWMAFCFELNKKKYFPVVNGDKLGFEETLTSDKKFWFQYGEKTGKWRTVQSVAKPDMYLNFESKQSNVIICSQPLQHFRIFFEVEPRSPVTTPKSISMSISRRYNDDSTQRMVVENFNITHYGHRSEERNEIKMIQDERPVYPHTRYRNDMSIQSNDQSTCQMVVQNLKISHNGNPREESRPEMIQDSRPMYLETRLRQYMWDRSKDGSTSQMVVEKIKISDDRNPRRGNKRI